MKPKPLLQLTEIHLPLITVLNVTITERVRVQLPDLPCLAMGNTRHSYKTIYVINDDTLNTLRR